MRAAPAFQVYASDDLASERYFGLSLQERGLLDAMRRGCWVSSDGSIPSEPGALAVVVRRQESEIRMALTAGVLTWFATSPDGKRLIDPELERQRTSTAARRNAQRDAANETNRKLEAKRLEALGRSTPSESATDAVTDSVSVSVLNRSETTRSDSQEATNVTDTFVDDYTKTERALRVAK